MKWLIDPVAMLVGATLLTLLLGRRGRALRVLVAVLALLLSLPASYLAAGSLWSVADSYVPGRRYDVVVPLGGMLDEERVPTAADSAFAGEPAFFLGRNGERLEAALRLIDAGAAPLLVHGSVRYEGLDEGAIVRVLALRHGLPGSRIASYGTVASTRDEALRLRDYLARHGLARVLLVTSQLHMRRARAALRRAGVAADTYSVNRLRLRSWPRALVPSVRGLVGWRTLLYELLAYAVYLARGWV